jgi:class 3 adenylate cyclase/predicted ATPase
MAQGATGRMRCSSCQSEFPDGVEACPLCGAAAAATCPSCGTLLRAIAKFCSECGAALTGAAERVGACARDASAERRQLTIMICDIVGSTALAAQLDPEDLREVLAACFRCVTEVVTRRGGFLARFMGDAALIYFGYPQAQENDVERAVRAGLEIVENVRQLEPLAGHQPSIRVGIATGLVVVGDTGRTGLSTIDQDVIGATPNLAARLQAIAGPGEVVIGASTHRLAGGLFEYRDLGSIVLKGFDEPMQAWQVLRPRAVESRFDAQYEAGRSTLIGREEELALLRRRWQQIESGGRVVLLVGEPGIGKSRIRRALQERIAGEHHIRLNFYCSPQHSDSAFYPVIHRFEQLAGFLNDDTAERKVAKLELFYRRAGADPAQVAIIAELLSLPVEQRQGQAELSPEQRKEQTVDALLQPLMLLSTRHPMLLVVEDVHWIDPSSLELLGLLIERVARLRMLLVVTARPEFSPPWPNHAHVTRVTLSRLHRDEAAALARETAGGRQLPDAVLDQILGRADGVPLFIEELTKAVLESGIVRERRGGYVLGEAPSIAAIPTTLHDSLMARLHRSGGLREVAQVGAAIGREFSAELLRAVSGLPANQVGDAVDKLVRFALLSRRADAPSTTYVFRHALIRDAAYGTLLREQRQKLHARIAAAIEERFPHLATQQPELLGHHCAEAGLIEKAVAYWGKAGRKAAARHAKIEAAVHFRRALKLLATLPPTPDRRRQELDLECGLGWALMAARIGAEETGQSYVRARKLCEELGDAASLMPVLGGLVMFHLGRCELGLARRTAEDLLRLGQEHADARASLAGHVFIGICSYWVGEFAAARRQLEHVLRFPLPVPEADRSSAAVAARDMLIGARCFLALTLLALGSPDQAARCSAETVAQSRALRTPQVLARELTYAALFNLLRRADEAALALAEEAITLAVERHYSFWREIAQIIRGAALAAHGSAAEGLRLARIGAADRARTGSLGGQPYFLALVAQLCERTEQPDEAWEVLRNALDMVEQTGERWFEPELHRLRGEWLRAHRADAQSDAEAEALFSNALALAQRQGAKLWSLRAALSLARLWASQGKRAGAGELLGSIYRTFTEGFDAPDLVEAKALIDELARANESDRRQAGSAHAHFG